MSAEDSPKEHLGILPSEAVLFLMEETAEKRARLESGDNPALTHKTELNSLIGKITKKAAWLDKCWSREDLQTRNHGHLSRSCRRARQFIHVTRPSAAF